MCANLLLPQEEQHLHGLYALADSRARSADPAAVSVAKYLNAQYNNTTPPSVLRAIKNKITKNRSYRLVSGNLSAARGWALMTPVQVRECQAATDMSAATQMQVAELTEDVETETQAAINAEEKVLRLQEKLASLQESTHAKQAEYNVLIGCAYAEQEKRQTAQTEITKDLTCLLLKCAS
jgi:FtsZ-binding cell division protein ZapB